MALKCGIVGLPNVGKSTLFNALSRAKALSENYPFCTIEPNLGTTEIADERLDILVELIKPKKITPNTMQFVDIAGLVKGASKGEGLGNQFLGHIREVDALAHVIRCFEDKNITHVDDKIDPLTDKFVIDTELQLKDIETIEKNISKNEKKAKSGDKELKKYLEVVKKLYNGISQGKNVREFFKTDMSKEEIKILEPLHLITEKPIIYLANIDEKSIIEGNEFVNALQKETKKEKELCIPICAALESQIAELNPEEKDFFLKEYHLQECALHTFIRYSYELLNLITFFTAGETEVRAWSIRKGTNAKKAAGVIHSDFEKGFIRVEVLKIADLQKYKTEINCKNAGKIALEGKEYIIEDGDILHFRFNV